MLPEKFVCATNEAATWTKMVPAPVFRKRFLARSADTGSLTIGCTGFYDLFLNGEKITGGYLMPYISNPDDVIFYKQYDLSNKLLTGENVLCVILGNGHANPVGGEVWGHSKRNHAAPAFALECVCGDLRFEAGDMVWNRSHILFDDYRLGCYCDMTLYEKAWYLPGYDDTEWNLPISCDYSHATKKLAVCESVNEIRRIKPIKWFPGGMHHYIMRGGFNVYSGPTVMGDAPTSGGYIYDFGENCAGVPLLRIKGEKGQKIQMQFCDCRYEGLLDNTNMNVYPAGCCQKDIYICSGDGIEEFIPPFTYHGFRYCYVHGITPEQATQDLLTYIVLHNDVKRKAAFWCSDEISNEIFAACTRSDLANTFYMITDCPTREKNGWTGDGHLAIEAALYNFDGITVYEKWMADHRDEQQPNGVLPDIIPTGGWGYGTDNGLDWTSTIAIIPWNLYLFYGDDEALRQCYPHIKRYVDYVGRISRGHLTTWGRGDWVPVTVGSNKELTSSVYYFVDTQILAQAAKLFGYTTDYEKYNQLANDIRKAINDKYLDTEKGIYASGTQTEQCVPLYWGIVPDEHKAKVAYNLNQKVIESGHHLDVGVLGCKALLNALCENGYTETAYKVAVQDTYPSWGWWVVNGATTLLENWKLDATRDISDNHMMFGEIGAWFYKGLAGIYPDSEKPGFKHIRLKPYFPKGLDTFSASHQSPYGQIVSGWTTKGKKVNYTVTIPANCTATLELPSGWAADGKQRIELQSGTYQFVCRMAK